MGLELRNRLESALGARVKATILWTYPTVRSLSEHLAKTLFPDDDAMQPEPHSEVPAVQNPSDEVAQLDDQQLLALIDDELALAKSTEPKQDVTTKCCFVIDCVKPRPFCAKSGWNAMRCYERTEPIAIVGMGCRFPGRTHSASAMGIA